MNTNVIFFYYISPRGGDSHMKQTGMLVVSLRGINFGFWSRLGCSRQSVNIVSWQSLCLVNYNIRLNHITRIAKRSYYDKFLLNEVINRQTSKPSLPSCFKSQCRNISRISNQFRKIEFWFIPPKQPFGMVISENDIKKSPSALHLDNFRKVRKFTKKCNFYS